MPLAARSFKYPLLPGYWWTVKIKTALTRSVPLNFSLERDFILRREISLWIKETKKCQYTELQKWAVGLHARCGQTFKKYFQQGTLGSKIITSTLICITVQIFDTFSHSPRCRFALSQLALHHPSNAPSGILRNQKITKYSEIYL